MFFWTPAHFWALAMKYRDDYAAGGFPMFPVVYGIELTTRRIAAYATITVALTFAMTLTNDVGQVYAAAVFVLGALFVTRAFALVREPDPPAGDPLLRLVERLPHAGVRRRCGRRARPLRSGSPPRRRRRADRRVAGDPRGRARSDPARAPLVVRGTDRGADAGRGRERRAGLHPRGPRRPQAHPVEPARVLKQAGR